MSEQSDLLDEQWVDQDQMLNDQWATDQYYQMNEQWNDPSTNSAAVSDYSYAPEEQISIREAERRFGDDKIEGQPKTWLDAAGEGVAAMFKDPKSMASMFGGALQASAQGVLGWLASKRKEKSDKYGIDMQKKVIDERVARASAVPSLKRATKDEQHGVNLKDYHSTGLLGRARAGVK